MKNLLYLFILFNVINLGSKTYSQDFWYPTNGPEGGFIYSLAINTSGDIFAGTYYGGSIYRSTDNGEYWIQYLPKSSVHHL